MKLIVDSAPIIKSATKLADISTDLITVPEVLKELKDQKTRLILAQLPHQIHSQTPSEEAISLVIKVAKKTGDFASLSLTDIKVIALTLQLEWEANGREHLRYEPIQTRVHVGGKPLQNKADSTGVLVHQSNIDKSHDETLGNGTTNQEPIADDLNQEPLANDLNDSQNSIQQNQDKETDKPNVQSQEKKKRRRKRKPKKAAIETLTEAIETISVDPSKEIPVDSIDSEKDKDEIAVNVDEAIPSNESQLGQEKQDAASDSDGGEWITPSNISKKKKSAEDIDDEPITDSIAVSCITDDFAMQNVLMQMKLNLVSINGLLIKRIKTFVLRCHACFKVTTIMDKTFCPTCGNNTLIKTTCKIDNNGNMKLFLKKNFKYNNRGTVYSIPQTKGGRRATNLILREDQNEHKKALLQKKRLEKKALNTDLSLDDISNFGQGSRLSVTGNPIIGYGRKNVNQVKPRRK